MTSVCRRRSVGSKRAPKSSVNSVCSVREKTHQRERKTSPHTFPIFFFSQRNTDERNTQHLTETLSQPISQNVTANLSWKASVNSVCRRRSVGSKRAPKSSVNSVCSVREKSPQRVTCVSSRNEGAFYFSQIYTDEQNTQYSTETLSQPISQNLTATFSYNVLWILYAGGLLWGQNCAQKVLLNLWVLWEKEIPFVREGTLQRLSWLLSHPEGAFFFSQKNTDEQNTQHSTETLSQPISQNLTATFSYNVLWILYAGGLLWGQNCAQKVLLNLWVLWEKMISSVRENFPTTLVSSPIGVTSHITPLPAGATLSTHLF